MRVRLLCRYFLLVAGAAVVVLVSGAPAGAQPLTIIEIESVTQYRLSDGRSVCIAGIQALPPEGTGEREEASIPGLRRHLNGVVFDTQVEYEKSTVFSQRDDGAPGCVSTGHLWLVDRETGLRTSSLGKMLLREGYAQVDTAVDFRQRQLYEHIQLEARINRVGLWEHAAR